MKTLIYIFVLLLFCYAIIECNPSGSETETFNSTYEHHMNMGGYYHGAEYANPVGYCDQVECHGTDLKGGNSGGKSCYDCHGKLW